MREVRKILPLRGRGTARSAVEGYQRLRGPGVYGYADTSPPRRFAARSPSPRGEDF
jgi:hypothetical protein